MRENGTPQAGEEEINAGKKLARREGRAWIQEKETGSTGYY